MHDELRALEKNNTWFLVARRPDMDGIASKWVYKIKLESNAVARLTERLFAHGYFQISRIDFDEWFTPVINPTINCAIPSVTVH